MSERQLDDGVRAIVTDIGRSFSRETAWLLAYHTHNSQHSPAGFPDWTFVGPRGVMFRENKTRKGMLTSEQISWKNALRAVDADYGIWRPGDLESGRIAYELLSLAGLNPARPKGAADA